MPPPPPGKVGHLARMAFLPESHVSGRVGVGGRGGRAWLPWSTAQRWGGALPLRRWGPPPRISRYPAWTPDREPSVLRSVPQGEGAGAGLLHKTPGPVSALSQPPNIDRRSRVQAAGPGKPPLKSGPLRPSCRSWLVPSPSRPRFPLLCLKESSPRGAHMCPATVDSEKQN